MSNLNKKRIDQINKQWEQEHKSVKKEWAYMEAEEQRRRDQQRVEKICSWLIVGFYALMLGFIIWICRVILK